MYEVCCSFAGAQHLSYPYFRYIVLYLVEYRGHYLGSQSCVSCYQPSTRSNQQAILSCQKEATNMAPPSRNCFRGFFTSSPSVVGRGGHEVSPEGAKELGTKELRVHHEGK